MLAGAIAVLVVTFAISFLCSLAEACVLSLSRAEIAGVAQRSPRIGAIWARFRQHLEQPLAVILILNTTALTIGTSLAAGRFAFLYGQRGVLIASAIVAFVMIEWAEVLPKGLGLRHRRTLAIAFGVPLQTMVTLLRPLVALIRLLNRPFDRGGKEPPTTIEEIRALARDARRSNVIGAAENAIIGRAAGLKRLNARRIMVPREEISFLSTNMTLNEAFLHAHMDAHTRFPLCDGGDIDKVLGYVNLKELVSILHTNPEAGKLRDIARPIHRVLPDANVASILRDFVGAHIHVALVESAGPRKKRTLGMMTMEDLLEEVVGELEDEFDSLPRQLHALGGSVLMAGGGADAAEALGRAGAALTGDERGTVAAWILARLGRLPVPGDEVEHGGVKVVVRRIRRGRVFEATFTRGPSAASLHRPQ